MSRINGLPLPGLSGLSFKHDYQKVLLLELEQEVVRTTAAAMGAWHAMVEHSLRLACSEHGHLRGKKIRHPQYGEALILAIEWRSYFRDYEGPVFVGRRILRTGKLSKTELEPVLPVSEAGAISAVEVWGKRP